MVLQPSHESLHGGYAKGCTPAILLHPLNILVDGFPHLGHRHPQIARWKLTFKTPLVDAQLVGFDLDLLVLNGHRS